MIFTFIPNRVVDKLFSSFSSLKLDCLVNFFFLFGGVFDGDDLGEEEGFLKFPYSFFSDMVCWGKERKKERKKERDGLETKAKTRKR